MKKSISELKGILKGQTVYVLGSGSSVDRIRPAFFEGKTVIGVNEIWKRFPVEYCVFTHQGNFVEAIGKTKCVVSEYDVSETHRRANEMATDEDYWTWNLGKVFDFEGNLRDVGKEDTLCHGNSVSIAAINFAAHLGATTILLVGFDCCAVNGRINYSGYENPNIYRLKDSEKTLDSFRMYKNDFFLRNAKEISIMRRKVEEVYGADVMTVSPFAGLMCENVELKDQLSMADMRRIND